MVCLFSVLSFMGFGAFLLQLFWGHMLCNWFHMCVTFCSFVFVGHLVFDLVFVLGVNIFIVC